MTPNRVNRAHWPTKENRQLFCYFCFFCFMEKIAWDGPKWGQEDFFLLIQTLPTFWAERIWILRTLSFFFDFLDSKFLDFHVPRFPKSGPGQAWAQTPAPPPPDEFSDPNLTPSPNAPRDQIRRKAPCCDVMFW